MRNAVKFLSVLRRLGKITDAEVNALVNKSKPSTAEKDKRDLIAKLTADEVKEVLDKK